MGDEEQEHFHQVIAPRKYLLHSLPQRLCHMCDEVAYVASPRVLLIYRIPI